MKINKALAIILTFVLCFGVMSFAFAEETPQVPEGYTPIYTAEDLNNIRNNLSGKYILMNNIDLSVYENLEPIGTSETPFTGELDGNNCIITSLKISVKNSVSGNSYYGLFGYIENSKIKNVSIGNSDITVTYSGMETARCYIGTIAGEGYMSEITDCVVSGKITTGNFLTTVAGGILGRDDMLCTLENCSNYSDIIAEATASSKYVYVGGIFGTGGADINACCNFGEIKAEGENVPSSCRTMVGGINGNGYEASVLTDCYNRGNISINYSTSDTFAGGVSGTSFVTKNAYNIGEIILPDNFIGYSGAISGSIGMGGASLPVVGMPSPYIENVYYIESDLTVAYADCLHPDEQDKEENASVYKSFAELTDENMKNQASYVGFDFENVWEMEENGYPILRNQPNLPENIPERPTAEPTTEPSTDPSTEPSAEPTDKSLLKNIWIVRAIEWVLNSIWKAVVFLVALF